MYVIISYLYKSDWFQPTCIVSKCKIFNYKIHKRKQVFNSQHYTNAICILPCIILFCAGCKKYPSYVLCMHVIIVLLFLISLMTGHSF